MNHDLDFSFHIPFTGTVDRTTGVIKGVSLMTGNLTAEGHDLEVDETTLKQVLACARKTGKIPVKLDHGSGIVSLCGFIDGATAQIDGEKVRGDWHLLKSHDEYETLLERAEKMPECFGLSAAFKGGGEVLKAGTKAGKKAARCERLLAVDCVTQPAANPGGLFSVPASQVDTRRIGMDANNPTNHELPADTPEWAKQLFATVTDAVARIEAIEGFNQDLQAGLNEPDLAQLANMTDEQLDQSGYDVAAVRQAVETAIASGELVEGESGGSQAGHAPANGNVPVAGNGNATTTGAAVAEMAAKAARSEIRQFIARQAQAEEAAALENAVTTLEAKAEEAAKEQQRLVTELATKDAEVKALRLTLKSTAGGRSVGAGVETTLFSGKTPAGSFEQLVQAKIAEFKAANPSLVELSARSKALDFCIRNHPAAYREYRSRGGKIEFAN